MPEFIGPVFGAVLALLVFTYLLGDNPLYRLALHLFVGVLVGYSLGVVVREVLLSTGLPKLMANPASAVVPFVLGILLLFKGFPEQAFVGNFSVAYLVGVGTAVALGGALLGTLIPQVQATGAALSPTVFEEYRFGVLDALMLVVGTISTLLAFRFTRDEDGRGGSVWSSILQGAAWLGRVFLIFAFGIAFAGAVTASLAIFIGRMQYFIDLALSVIGL